MNVSSVSGASNVRAQSNKPTSSALSAASGTTGANNSMMGVGKSDFMKLLVAQLQNQDPMQPMQDREFITQMAQLNTVEELTAMTTQLTTMLNMQEIAQASALIGKRVAATTLGNDQVDGVVQKVWIDQGKPTLIVNNQQVGLADVNTILAAG